jgi:alpha-beta hydrolase superfamily lysophospholipase
MLDLQTPEGTRAGSPADIAPPCSQASRQRSRHNAARGHLTATDGVVLHQRSWLPNEQRPAATLLFVHGIASHSAWFADTAAFLADRGIAVYAPDRRGSGLSGGPRGPIPSYEQAITDLHASMDHAVQQHPDAPVFLAGSSWAAKLAVATAAQAQAQDRLSGLLLLGPGLFPHVDLTPRQKAAVLVAHRLRPEQQVSIPLVPGHYTRQAAPLAYIANDPYRLLTASARFFWETRRLDRARSQFAGALTLPVLLQIGGADRIMDVAATCRWVNDLPSCDRTVVVYRDAAHTLDFEAEPTAHTYRAHLLGWLRRQLEGRAPRDRTTGEANDVRRR